MEEIAPVWYILTGDRARLDDKELTRSPTTSESDDTLDLIIEVQE